jgi:hypothetical protein
MVVLSSAPGRAVDLALSVGEWDIENNHGDGPVEAGFVLRLTNTVVHRFENGAILVPAFGAMATEENAFYGWAGGAVEIPLGARWLLVPELGAGVYERGDGKNLGGQLEFRSGVAASYRTSEALSVGVQFYHLSNAGVHDVNPGTNSLVLVLGITPRSRSGVWDTAGLR